MVRIAGRPILGHILERFRETAIEEVVVIIGGPMKQQVVEYAKEAFSHRFNFTFVEQPSPEGLGHSIYQAKPAVEGEPVIIALGDMIFENGYQTFLTEQSQFPERDGRIGVKPVDEPQHYGVVDLSNDNRIQELVEKPDDPPSNLAISGVYIINNTQALFEALKYLISNQIRGAGDEYQLTDALQLMVERGAVFDTFEVEDWYDCGRPETLLEANQVCLDQRETRREWGHDNCVIIHPVEVGDNVETAKSVIGPYVSIDDGVRVTNSILKECIVGQKAELHTVNLESSIIGDNAEVSGNSEHLNVGDYSVVDNV